MGKIPSRLSILLVVTLLVGCDHATKGVAKAHLENTTARELIRGVVGFQYVENTDIAFNLLRWIPETTRTPLLLVIGALAVITVTALLLRGLPAIRGSRLALVLITAGAIGNYLDRVLRGYVVDFVHLRHWPVFNVADVYITLGYVILGWAFVVAKRRTLERPT